MSTRSKPRLAKVKKPLGFQRGPSKTVSNDYDSAGFNPFRSVSSSSSASAVKGNKFSDFSNGFHTSVDSPGFVFTARRTDFVEPNVRVEQSVSGAENDRKLNFDTGFKETRDSSSCVRVLGSDEKCQPHMNVDFGSNENHKVQGASAASLKNLDTIEGKGVFVFGKCSSQSYAFDTGMSHNNPGNNTENVFLHDDANEKRDFVFRTSDVLPKTSLKMPFSELPHEMSKLNISDSQKVTSTDTCKGSDTPSGDVKNLSKSSGSPSVTCQNDNSSSICPENADAVEKTTGIGSNGHDFSASSINGVENKDILNFKGPSDKSASSSMEFRTDKWWDPSSFKEVLFSELNTKVEFSAKSRLVNNKVKKSGRKYRQPSIPSLSTGQNFVSKGSTCPEHSESPGSPMDSSPYLETVVSDLYSRNTSLTSPVSCHLGNDSEVFTAHSNIHIDVTNGLGVFKEDSDIDRGSKNCNQTLKVDSSADTSNIFKASGMENWPLNAEQICSLNGSSVNSVKVGTGVNFDSDRHDSNCEVQFAFASAFEDMGERRFSFSAQSSSGGNSVVKKRQYRKKNRLKASSNKFIISPRSKAETITPSFENVSSAGPSSHLRAVHCENGDVIYSEYKEEATKEHVEQRSISASAAIWEACDKWRLRGNKAYENKELSQAEEFYTRGIKSVPRRERSGCCLEPLVLCYSNRAAARMSLGRIREALGDCMRATALDSNFLKAQIRAANCHLLLGEVDDAVQYFKNCLKSGNDACLDRRIVIQASDGLQKAQKVAASTKLHAELFEQRESNYVEKALTFIDEALSISPYSEKLLEMKAETIYMLQKYEDVIRLCEQTLTFAEKIFSPSEVKDSFVRMWRHRMISRSYFHLGKLEAALDLLEKQEEMGSNTNMFKEEGVESPTQLAVTIRELLHRKRAGNEAFQSGRHADALEHYTAALSTNIHSRPFTAICFCNRAAAHQALGQIGEAIADCSLAIALDGNYSKALSRRATLHEMIRDYAQAANDLQRFISIIEKQSHEKSKHSGESRQTNVKELRQARRRLSLMEDQAKINIPLDLYLILGIKGTDTSSEIKKSYRKAALRHHPDKAGQFLARSESADDGRLWKEIAEEVHKDSERLFKIIGEANGVLSDPTKRSMYDIEEEMRKAPRESNRSSAYRGQPDVHRYPFEQRNGQQTWWKTRSTSYSRG